MSSGRLLPPSSSFRRPLRRGQHSINRSYELAVNVMFDSDSAESNTGLTTETFSFICTSANSAVKPRRVSLRVLHLCALDDVPDFCWTQELIFSGIISSRKVYKASFVFVKPQPPQLLRAFSPKASSIHISISSICSSKSLLWSSPASTSLSAHLPPPKVALSSVALLSATSRSPTPAMVRQLPR